MVSRHADQPFVWQGREDTADGADARRWHQLVNAATGETGSVAIAGFACDAGVVRNQGRAGAAAGPLALRRALANLPVHGLEAVDDLGDVACEGDALENAQAEFAALVAAALGRGALLIGIGGGHEIALATASGLVAALAARGDTAPVGIVNFDSHFDLRADARGSSGTPFRQILEQASGAGRDLRYCCLGVSRYANTAALGRFVESVGHVYLTVCLDVFPAHAAPGVSAPAALGVEPALVERLIDGVVASGKLHVADVAELNPAHDVDGRTARLAARLVARIAEAHAALG